MSIPVASGRASWSFDSRDSAKVNSRKSILMLAFVIPITLADSKGDMKVDVHDRLLLAGFGPWTLRVTPLRTAYLRPAAYTLRRLVV